jgi:peptide/nickel transport system ATP-binding protein
MTPLLEVRDLRVALPIEGALQPVLRGVDLVVGRGEVLALVGESGSGKSVTARSIMRLLPNGATLVGDVTLDGMNLLGLTSRELRRVRARKVAMIFQDPRASINPVRSCGAQIMEVLRVGQGMSAKPARVRAAELLEMVSISDAQRVLNAYPFELSGGMLQRVLIAIALAAKPDLIIADEATTSLDVTVQADIVGILDGLRKTSGIGLLFITHDLELAAAISDRIAVMYAGRIVEEQVTGALFSRPRHPYSAGLLAARPEIHARQIRLKAIPGSPPGLSEIPLGCPFHPRCSIALGSCATEWPVARRLDSQVLVACHRAEEAPDIREVLAR